MQTIQYIDFEINSNIVNLHSPGLPPVHVLARVDRLRDGGRRLHLCPGGRVPVRPLRPQTHHPRRVGHLHGGVVLHGHGQREVHAAAREVHRGHWNR